MCTIADVEPKQIKRKYSSPVATIDTDYIYYSHFITQTFNYAFDAISGTNQVLLDYRDTIDNNGEQYAKSLATGNTVEIVNACKTFMSDITYHHLCELDPYTANNIIKQNNAKIIQLAETYKNMKLVNDIEQL